MCKSMFPCGNAFELLQKRLTFWAINHINKKAVLHNDCATLLHQIQANGFALPPIWHDLEGSLYVLILSRPE